jgi:hypothetical protein
MSAFRLLPATLFTIAILLRWSAPASAADPSAPRRLPVTVCDFAGVEPSVLAAAETVASDVYRSAGVTIEWAESGCIAGPPGLYVNLVSVDSGDVHLAELMVGFAESGGLTATVLYNRIERLARHHHKKPQMVLGYVIAHELGHLLLPPHSHSATGIMQPALNLDSGAEVLRVSFTPEQAELIAGKLQDPSSKIQAPHTEHQAPGTYWSLEVGTYSAARPQNCCEAMRAPSAIAASLPQTTSGSTAAWPTHVP